MKKDTAKIIEEQLALCAAALQETLDHAHIARGRDWDETARDELASAARLLQASARLGLALARLKGASRHTIRVERGGQTGGKGESLSGGSIGQKA